MVGDARVRDGWSHDPGEWSFVVPGNAPTSDDRAGSDAGVRVRGDGISVRVPRDTSYLGVIRAAVSSLARRAGFDPESTGQVEMAVDEVCSNAILHARGEEPAIEVDISAGDFGIRVAVCDFGRPFHMAGAEDLDRYYSRRESGGLGSYIIRRFMDEVFLRYAPGRGNEFVLIRHRSSRRGLSGRLTRVERL